MSVFMCVCVCVYLWAHSLHVSKPNTGRLRHLPALYKVLCHVSWSGLWWCQTVSKCWFMNCDGGLLLMLLSEDHFTKEHGGQEEVSFCFVFLILNTWIRVSVIRFFNTICCFVSASPFFPQISLNKAFCIYVGYCMFDIVVFVFLTLKLQCAGFRGIYW